MSERRLRYLFSRYFDKTASAEERAELMALLGKSENDENTYELLREAWHRLDVGEVVFTEAQGEAMLRNVLTSGDVVAGGGHEQVKGSGMSDPVPVSRPRLFMMRRAAAAAVILLVVGGGVYWSFFRKTIVHQQAAPTVATAQKTGIDVPAPNGNNAILTLEDGSTVVLDSVKNGALSQQGGAQVSKSDAGKLVYQPVNEMAARTVYNTVSTRRGGQYQIVLPDGTKVWLNTVSKLRFPTAFTGHERVVELSGEAYFEVVKNDKMPFRVHVLTSDKGMDVRVLGTHFNVMAYENEAEIKTTLLEGAVKVSGSDRSSVLAPGQQVKLDKQGVLRLDEHADVELAMAWKNGFTSFKSADIKSIMRQVERWYDIEVVYEGDVSDRTFSGGISRDANLFEIIRLLEVSKIHFKMVGRKLTVIP